MGQEGVEVWCMGEEMDLPAPTALEELAANTGFSGGVWMLIDVDVSRLGLRNKQKPIRVNISLPAGLVEEIDAAARASGATRSGFLAKAARQAMAH